MASWCSISQGAKLCAVLRCFARPDKVDTELRWPFYATHELPLSVTKLRSIFHHMGAPKMVSYVCSFLAGRAGQPWDAQGATKFAQIHNFVPPMRITTVLSATRAMHGVFDCLVLRVFGSSMHALCEAEDLPGSTTWSTEDPL